MRLQDAQPQVRVDLSWRSEQRSSSDADLAGQLERISNLWEKGMLNDDEFAAAKGKLLDSD